LLSEVGRFRIGLFRSMQRRGDSEMKVKIRRSRLEKNRLCGFLSRRKSPGGRKVIARQRRRRK